MKTLIAVQALFAAVLLLLGIVLTFALGITGLLFLLAGGLFAAMASLADTRSRAAVVAVLAFDAAVAAFAASKLVTLLTHGPAPLIAPPEVAQAMTASAMDLAMPSVVIVLVGGAFVAVALDWRGVRNSKWF